VLESAFSIISVLAAPASLPCIVRSSDAAVRVDDIQREADPKGKADWKMDLEVTDQAGEGCCLLQGVWQMRKQSGSGLNI
jgi:hypothetical protein